MRELDHRIRSKREHRDRERQRALAEQKRLDDCEQDQEPCREEFATGKNAPNS